MSDALKRQYGPLSGAGWLVVIVVGVGAGLALKRFIPTDGAGAAGDLEDAPTDDVAGEVPFTLPGGGTVGVVPSPRDVATQPAPPATNSEWVRLGISRLIGAGVAPALVDTALRRYVEGLPLDPSQSDVVDQALRMIGPPPADVAPRSSVPAPTSPTTSPGSSPTSIAADTVEAYVKRIVGANPSLRGQTTIPGGFPLKVPLRDGTVKTHRIGTVGTAYPIREQAARFARIYHPL